MNRYSSPLDLPDEHMRLVGIIAAHWEALDSLLQNAVAGSMGMKLEAVRLLTESLTTNAKIDLITAHARDLPKTDFKAINKALDEVRAAYVQRNTFVHAKWYHNPPSPDTPWRFSVRTKGGRRKIIQMPTPQSELEQAAEAILKARDRLKEVLEEYRLL
jgi:hypothetical protein